MIRHVCEDIRHASANESTRIRKRFDKLAKPFDIPATKKHKKAFRQNRKAVL